tara:strand:- start:228 stop:410 length:183 start_codon:yes stop_codon:yes gene_type:complete
MHLFEVGCGGSGKAPWALCLSGMYDFQVTPYADKPSVGAVKDVNVVIKVRSLKQKIVNDY